MLDVELFKAQLTGSSTTRLLVCCIDPTRAPHTHIAWPSSYVTRLKSISSLPGDFSLARDAFLARLAKRSRSHMYIRRRVSGSRVPRPPIDPHNHTHIVLPFFYGFEISEHKHELCRSMRRYSGRLSQSSSIAWSLGGRHAYSVLQNVQNDKRRKGVEEEVTFFA